MIYQLVDQKLFSLARFSSSVADEQVSARAGLDILNCKVSQQRRL